MQPNPPPNWIGFAISATVILVVLAIRMRRAGRDRPLRIEQLWIIPALYLCLTIAMFWRYPPTGLVWIAVAAGLGIGAALGWKRGQMMHISVNPETHEISQRASPAAMLFLLGLVVVRVAAREASELGGAGLHLDVAAVTDVLIVFALGLLAAQRLEMYLRARALLDGVRRA